MVEAACGRVGDAALQAKAPKDLDNLLAELRGFLADAAVDRSVGTAGARLILQVRGNITFIEHWQDYLLARSRKDSLNVEGALKAFANNDDPPQPVPRSEILARMAENQVQDPANQPAPSQEQIDANVRATLHTVKRLDDVSAAIDALQKMRQQITSKMSYSFANNSVYFASLNALEALESTYQELQNGLPTGFTLGDRTNGFDDFPDAKAVLLPLRVQLLKLTVPRLLEIPESERPKDEETLDAYLHRFVEAAKLRRDWPMLRRGLDLRRALAAINRLPYTTSNEQQVAAFDSFFAALNLEAAGQYEQAAISYLESLRSGQQELPVAFIGERLAALQKDHAAESAAATSEMIRAQIDPAGHPEVQRLPGSFDPATPARSDAIHGPPGDDTLQVPRPVSGASPAS